METERKYLVNQVPENYRSYPCHAIEQAYLCTAPVVRIRREDDAYYLTYKGQGLLSREEYNLPLTEQAYLHLLPKADGIVLVKKRYLIPLEGPGHLTAGMDVLEDPGHLTIEMDVFEGRYEGLVLAEVEFATEEEAMAFAAPDWFGRDVTFTGEYQNSLLSQGTSAVAPDAVAPDAVAQRRI